ncbi:uncharacterized protein F4822DRAFT_324685 [Hypoxylon trugodes]|uniref:uncharacterized protein n=1 Tax=Hypoxylon trugodes TaxID=326681 RepID=UPI002192588E|nr:uncharacterized protein F4822DRAFT_324685 [Hypoxylon trugodes]KAI1386704.1 hypothetical protein F4822DRAFT_324685 [Hypoxylon trugodes]
MAPAISVSNLSRKGGIIALITLVFVWSLAAIVRQLSFFHQPLSLALRLPLRRHDPPLILYAYKESQNARENLKFFLDQGLHGSADFIFILNGETDVADLIPKEKNIRVVQRPNVCFDLGAFGEVLRADDLWKKYQHFITINASLRGPFIPHWSKQCWSDAYLDRVTDDVKLVGMTINCSPKPHVQSMIWATDNIGMEFLLYPPSNSSELDPYGTANDTVAFGGCYEEFHQAIHAEVGATSVIRNAGYQISAMMSAFQGEQYLDKCDEHPKDLLYDGKYFGTNLHPYDTIFFKANRGIDPTTLDLLSRLHLSGYPGRSWELCRR